LEGQSDNAFQGGSALYKALFEAENEDIGLEKAHFWGVNDE
jgi:hypothetical protein